MVQKTAGGVARVAERKRWRTKDARVVVEAWQASGQTMEAFARVHAIHPHRLGRWVRQLRNGVTSEKPEFHPVRVVGARPFVSEDGRIEVVVGDVTIRLPSGFAGSDLGQVLAALEGRASC